MFQITYSQCSLSRRTILREPRKRTWYEGALTQERSKDSMIIYREGTFLERGAFFSLFPLLYNLLSKKEEKTIISIDWWEKKWKISIDRPHFILCIIFWCIYRSGAYYDWLRFTSSFSIINLIKNILISFSKTGITETKFKTVNFKGYLCTSPLIGAQRYILITMSA